MTTRISQLTAAATLTGAEIVEVSQLSASVTITGTTISADASDNSFNDSANGFVTAGFTTGKSVKVSGFTGNVANNIVSGVVTSAAAGKLIIGGTDGDVIVTDAAGESVTITQWDSKRSTAQNVADLSGVAAGREALSAARTYYVRTDGSDSNDGLANTAGGAFLTIQKGLDVASTLDTAGFSVTIKVQDATWTAALTVPACIGGGKFILEGNTSTPANCHLSVTGAAVTVAHDLAYINIRGFKITGSTYGIFILPAGRVEFQSVEFGASSSQHIFVAYRGYVEATGNYAIVGAAACHIITTAGSYSRINSRTITITGTPAFTTFAQSAGGGIAFMQGCTFSGSATGKRYDVISNAILDTNAGGSTYLPGNVAGTTATGGQYV